MEEQRQRQDDEARRAAVVSAGEAGVPSPTDGKRTATSPFSITSHLHWYLTELCSLLFFLHAESEDALLKMSVPQAEPATPSLPDFSRMTEDEQIAYALQMSMQGAGGGWSQTICHRYENVNLAFF